MTTTHIVLASLFTVAMALMIAPRVFHMNKGKVLQNMALWLAIFLGLALLYQTLGIEEQNQAVPPALEETTGIPQPDESLNTDAPLPADQDFMPPRE